MEIQYYWITESMPYLDRRNFHLQHIERGQDIPKTGGIWDTGPKVILEAIIFRIKVPLHHY